MWGAMLPTFPKAFPVARGRPDLKKQPKKSGQTAFRYPGRGPPQHCLECFAARYYAQVVVVRRGTHHHRERFRVHLDHARSVSVSLVPDRPPPLGGGLPPPRPPASFWRGGGPAPKAGALGAGAPQKKAGWQRPRGGGLSGTSETLSEAVASGHDSAELSHSLKVSDRRRNTPKSVQNRSESLCVGLGVPCRIFWVWFDPALGPNPARNRRFPTGSLKVFGALLAQPSVFGFNKCLTWF